MSDVYKAPDARLTSTSSSEKYGSVEKGLVGEYQLAYKKMFSEAWEKSKGTKLTFFLAMVIYVAISIAVTFAAAAIIAAFGLTSIDPETNPELFFDNMPLMFGGAALQNLLNVLIMTPLWAGLLMMGIRRSVDYEISVGDLFAQFSRIVPLFFTVVLMYFFLLIGYALLFLPGIYLTIAYLLAVPLVVDKNMNPWQALETSRKVVTKHWFRMFGFSLLTLLVIVLGGLALGIGLLWAIPVAVIAMGIAYRNMVGVSSL